MDAPRIKGLIAATHTPFNADGSMRLDVVAKQAAHLLSNGVKTVFICGTTGEGSSLTLDERRALAERWMDASRGSAMKVIVHVGHNCLREARDLAAHAQKIGALAVASITPSFFKPSGMQELVDSMAEVAAGAPAIPFYYYEFPTQSGVTLSPSGFLESATETISNLVGIKFTSANLMEYQLCRAANNARYDALFGCDEILLSALALGAEGAVGSTYNFAAPIYHRVMESFRVNDLEAARSEQSKSVRLVQVLARYGYMGAAKTLMEMQGVAVGPPRLPNRALNAAQKSSLRDELHALNVVPVSPA